MRDFKTIFTTREITARANVKGYFHEKIKDAIKVDFAEYLNLDSTKYEIEIEVAGATNPEDRRYRWVTTFVDTKTGKKIVDYRNINSSRANCIMNEYERFRLKF